MSQERPPQLPKSPLGPKKGPDSPNWGVWLMLIFIVGVLGFGFLSPESFGMGTKKETLPTFETLYKEGRIVTGSKKLPLVVVLDHSSATGLIDAYMYKPEVKPTITKKPFYLLYKNDVADRDKPNFSDTPNYVVSVGDVAEPAVAAQAISVKDFNALAAQGRIIGAGEHGALQINESASRTGNTRVSGDVLEYHWPQIEKDGNANMELVQRIKVSFDPTFQGDKVKNLLGENATYVAETGPWWSTLLSILPFVLLVLLLVFMFRAQGGGPRGAMSFGKSRARLNPPDKNKITIKDVAGISEAKEEVWEIVEFLKNPKKFRELGASVPRGVLMVGSPGTGKTLLAKAIAGEANAAFYSISGSDFVEMFVGVGASRVRDMFEQAKKTSPSLIFIDEIDAVGRQRGYGMGGGNDEREQTLNAMLVEMDGFEATENVIVIAATNRPDVLDPALLRPGRFDRQVVVNLPDVTGREQILEVHARKVKMAEDVDLKPIARGTSGFSGAQLANLINEAALLSARKGLKEIRNQELEEARDKVCWGKERRSLTIDDRGKRITAVHEAGHAICNLKTENSEPLHRVTIIPRGNSLGSTMMLPTSDKFHSMRSEMLDQIVVAMGGRCAEQIIFGDVTSGASGDIRMATNIARRMVCEFGMSDKLGMVEYGEHQGEVFIARDLSTRSRNYSEETAQLIDAEVRGIIDEAYRRAIDILTTYQDRLELISDALIEYETLEGEQVIELLETGKMENPPEKELPPPLPEEEESTDKEQSPSKESEQTESEPVEQEEVSPVDSKDEVVADTLNPSEESKPEEKA